MTLKEIRTALADALKEHPAPWTPDGERYVRRGVLSEARDGGDGTYPEERDIVDATGDHVVERDCGMYEPHGATFRFIVQAPTMIATLIAYIDERQTYNESFLKTSRVYADRIRELAAALESSEARRDAACRGNVRLAAELEKATKRIAELEGEQTARRYETQGPSHGEY